MILVIIVYSKQSMRAWLIVVAQTDTLFTTSVRDFIFEWHAYMRTHTRALQLLE